MSVPTWLINCDSQDLTGLVAEVAGTAFAGSPRFLRDANTTRRIRLQTRGLDRDLTGGALEVAVGKLDLAPTDGTFALAFGGNSTNLTALSYAISKGDLQTALNSNPAISGAGGVTVEGTSRLFTITFNTAGARALLTGDDSRLLPPSYLRFAEKIAGDVSTREVQTLQIFQRAYAFNDDWTPNAAGSASLVTLDAGSPGTFARYAINFVGTPIGGSLALAWASPQRALIRIYSDNEATAETRFFVVANTPAELTESFFDIFMPDESYLRVWFNVDAAGTAPAVGATGTLVEIALASADTAADISEAIVTALDLEADIADAFPGAGYDHPSGLPTQFRTPAAFGYTLAADGSVREPEQKDMEFETTAAGTAGTDGAMAGQWFTIADSEGIVGVYFTAGRTTSIPEGLEDAYYRLIPVALDMSETADVVASKLATALDADDAYDASATASVVTVTDEVGGERTTPIANVGGHLTVDVTRPGVSVAADIPFDYDASQISAALEEQFAVVIREDKWLLTCRTAGLQEEPTCDDDALLWPSWFEGTLNFDTVALEYAFAGESSDTLNTLLEIWFTPLGLDREPVLQIRASIDRNLIRAAGFGTPAFATAITEILTGNTLWLDGEHGVNASAARERLDLSYFTAPAAQTAALSGDTIRVFSGDYVVDDTLAKNGVSFDVPPNTSIRLETADGVSLFDDQNSELVMSIAGLGDFSSEDSSMPAAQQGAVIYLQHADSDFTFRGRDILCDTPNGDDSASAITHLDGRLDIDCRDILATFGIGIYWENGEHTTRCARIVANGAAIYSYGQVGAMTGEFNVRADYVSGQVGVNAIDLEATARSWLNINHIVGTLRSLTLSGVGKPYVRTQKLTGKILIAGGTNYVETLKLSANAVGTLIEISGGTNRLELFEINDEGLLTGNLIACSGGTTRIRGMEYTGGATAQGVTVSAGTLIFEDCIIDTTANNATDCITVSGTGTVIFKGNNVLRSNAGRNTIAAGSAFTVKNLGVLTMNRPEHANITIHPDFGVVFVDSDVPAL